MSDVANIFENKVITATNSADLTGAIVNPISLRIAVEKLSSAIAPHKLLAAFITKEMINDFRLDRVPTASE